MYVGYQSLYTNTTGTRNTAVGRNALLTSTTSSDNSAFGDSALGANTTGAANDAFGRTALLGNTTGASNSAFGYQSLYTNSTGSYNTALGNSALYSNTTASNNTAVGYQAGYTSNGGSNVYVGYQAGYTAGNGTDNVCIGFKAGYGMTTGHDNICLGSSAGYNGGTNAITTGYANVILGELCRPSSGAGTYELVIGYNAQGLGTGTGYIDKTCYNGGNTSTWATTSDQRLKKNIVDNNIGLDVVNQIRVRNFEYRLPEEVTELNESNAVKIEGVQLGVIAQELQQVLPNCVKEESTGVLRVDTDNLIWYAINSIKELNAKVTALEAQLGAK